MATSALPPVLSHLSLAKIWSWSIAVATAGSLKSMRLRSLGWYSAPVAGFFASRTWAYSL